MRTILLLFILVSTTCFAGGGFKARIEFKIGSGFNVESEKIRGTFKKNGNDDFKAKKIRASLSKMTTGNATRDKHMKERFSSSSIIIKDAIAKNGKGQAIIKMNAVSKKVIFQYKKIKNQLKVNFDINLSDYGLKGISYGDILLKDTVNIVGQVDIK